MPDKVSGWLSRLNLEDLVEVFAEQKIEFDDLFELTDADLKEIGVPLGPRKRLLRAITELQSRREQGSVSDPAPEAERRQLTVLFCDLVGSTQMSTRLDPEDLREIISACHDSWTRSIEECGGFVARYMGDGALAYFGYPHAHEDAPEQAIRSGLRIAASTTEVQTNVGDRFQVKLGVRVGIATGPVVVGDLIGEGVSAESTVIGETPNLAARLQGVAEPNAVVVSPITHALTRGHFSFEDLGPHRLKGIDTEVNCWQVTAERAAESRFAGARTSGLTELIGREEELNILMRRWERAAKFEGQLVMISGEPGIGKSRMVQTVSDRVRQQGAARFHYQCSPMHSDTALFPVVNQIQGAAGIVATDSPATKTEKLAALIDGQHDDQALLALAAMLSIPAEQKFSEVEPDPDKRKIRTFEAVIGQLQRQAGDAPVLCIFEDVHWIDPSTRELLEQLVERLSSLQALVLVTYRPEFEAPWTGLANATLIALNRMASPEVSAMIARVSKGKALPAEIREEIIAKTDGIPLFVEELTRTVLESGLLREEQDRYELTAPLPPLAIPATLQDSLTARLDRLSSVKQIAQLGAVIGRSFSYSLLAAVASLDDHELTQGLSRLEESGLVLRRGTPPNATYTFKHALIRDSAYQSLLTASRQTYHLQIARVLENDFPDVAETDPALLALHFTEAGLTDRAIDYWTRAGQRALDSSAYQEAINSLQRALELLGGVADSAEKVTNEIGIRLMLGASRLQVFGQGSDEALASYTRAWELCDQGGTAEQRFRAQWGMHFVNMIKGDLIQSRDIGLGLVPLAEDIGDPDLLLEAHHVQWSTMFALGQIDACNVHLDYVIPRYQRERHHRLTFDFGGHDPGVCAFDIGALLQWLQGNPEQARQLVAQALELAEDLAHPFTLFESHMCAGYVRVWERDSAAQKKLVQRIDHFVQENLLPQICVDFVTGLFGAARVEEGHLDEGMGILAPLIGDLSEGFGPWTFPMNTVHAHGLAKGGKIDEGAHHVKAMLQVAEQGGVHWWDAEFHRTLGEIALLRGSEVEAAQAFVRAMECAREQQNRFLELRAAVSLARLKQGAGDGTEARAGLAEAVGAYPEGQEIEELQTARKLLAAL